jgi:hypothetical protein
MKKFVIVLSTATLLLSLYGTDYEIKTDHPEVTCNIHTMNEKETELFIGAKKLFAKYAPMILTIKNNSEQTIKAPNSRLFKKLKGSSPKNIRCCKNEIKSLMKIIEINNEVTRSLLCSYCIPLLCIAFGFISKDKDIKDTLVFSGKLLVVMISILLLTIPSSEKQSPKKTIEILQERIEDFAEQNKEVIPFSKKKFIYLVKRHKIAEVLEKLQEQGLQIKKV